MEQNNSSKEKARELVAQMTLEEKASLCSGKDCWNLKEIKRLGLESVMISDGPHGLRKQIGSTDNLGIGDSVPAVCFPTASALACSFDPELAAEVGKAMGEECLTEDVSAILGPGVNIKRSPVCGRNFEYYSEDPLLSGEMAAGMICGVQSMGVGTSLKHFAVNNQERRRLTVNVVVDERSLREIYLKSFEIAVKKGKPRTVMCAYNRLGGEYCSENHRLLTNILRKEWGYDGMIVSDWGSVNDRPLGIRSGLDLEMPGSRGINDKKIVEAVKSNQLSEEELDEAARRVTEFILDSMDSKQPEYRYKTDEHHRLAVSAAEQSAVLLKNKDRLLPGGSHLKAAVIGAFAKQPRYQGAGSSKLHPIKVDCAYDAFLEQGIDFTYAPGYYLGKETKLNEVNKAELIAEACEAAKEKDIVYLFTGLPEGYESEGFDRSSLALPKHHNELIEAVAACNPNVAVILHGGAPMELPWLDQVSAVLMAYLSGEGGGKAVVNLLTGKAVPCGKLAETWPLKLSDNPSYHYFPGGRETVEYRESIYVGYRYYEKAKKQVLFPFGYGLSYVGFSYSDLTVDKAAYNYGDNVKVSFTITNTGDTTAKETALIFTSHQEELVFLPEKELRGFTKVSLLPGESRRVYAQLNTGDFGYYNTLIKDWYAPSGSYEIIIGASSSDLRLQKSILLDAPHQPQPDYLEKAPTYYKLTNQEFAVPDAEFRALYQQELPVHDSKAARPFTHCNTLEDIEHTLIGKLILIVADRMAEKVTSGEGEQEAMMFSMIKEMPFHSLVYSGEGVISERQMNAMIHFLNGHYIKGIRMLLFGK